MERSDMIEQNKKLDEQKAKSGPIPETGQVGLQFVGGVLEEGARCVLRIACCIIALAIWEAWARKVLVALGIL